MDKKHCNIPKLLIVSIHNVTCLLFVIFHFMCFYITANADNRIGTWTLYPSYSDITEIEPAGDNTYVLASGALFSYNYKDGMLSTYDKNNTLSDNTISHIAWAKNTKRLVITYANSNIDLLNSDGTCVNISDLYTKSTTYAKTINHIYIYGTDAYLSTSFGIVRLNVKSGYIQDSYILNMNIDYCYIEGNIIYAASRQDGLYSCAFDSNLLDKNSWKRIGNYTPLNEDRTNVYDASTKFWWTKNSEGKLTYYTIDLDNKHNYKIEGVCPDGPASNKFYRLYFHDGKLYSVAGLWSQEKDGHNPGEVHVWDGKSWAEFEQPSAESLEHNYIDLLCMDFDPLKAGHVMVGAKSGLYEFQDGKFVKCYNGSNSLLASPFELPGGYNYTIVTSVKYDLTGQLWALNTLVDSPIKKFSATNGQWEKYSHQELSGTNNYNLQKLFISKKNGKMWFVNNYYQVSSLFSYDYVNDILDRYGPEIVNQDGKKITIDYIFCTTEDKYGNVWIGSTSGPLYLAANDISSNLNIFTQHKVPRNDGTNYADYLLAETEVRAIAVDGGNRKWIGSGNNGIFVISDDCNTQIHHFTTSNSPLPSNIIIDIAIDESTGCVFIATDKGLCSYMNDATAPAENMTKDNVTVYPNPVTPDYTGPITIVGLSHDASVKIVTSSGALVNEGRSTGGTYVWDGCDFSGRRVASGVYMVETATQNGEKGTVCKVALIR